MCYDLSYSTSIESILDYLPELQIDPQLRINFEPADHVKAFDHPLLPVVTASGNQYNLRLHEWGIVGRKTINQPRERLKYLLTRQENISNPTSVWSKLKKQRCLVAVSGVFEHRRVSGYNNKIPYYIRPRERSFFLLPGLFHEDVKPSFSLITTVANSLMQQIHNDGENRHRMPLFLSPELERRWLQQDLTDLELQEILSYQLPSAMLESHTVYSLRKADRKPGAATHRMFYAGIPEIRVSA